MRFLLSLLFLFIVHIAAGQTGKKPLDPSVYDGWQRVNEKILSADGKYIAFTVTPQEGDGRLFIRSTAGSYAKEIPRGANAAFTADNRFVVFLIRPLFKDSREARIKKKTPDQSPKDTLAWMELGTDSLIKIPRVKSYKVPDRAGAWLAYLLEKPEAATGAGGKMDSLTRIRQMTARADSLARLADSLHRQIQEVGAKGWTALPASKKEGHGSVETIEEGTDLIVRNPETGEQKKFTLTSEYHFSRNGNTLVV